MSKTLVVLWGVVFSLLATGIVLVATASGVRGQTLYNDQHYFLARQLVWVVLALPVWFAAGRIDYRWWRRNPKATWTLCACLLLLLLAVVTPGLRREVNGSFRWLRLGPVNVQPSELAKFMTVVAMSLWLSEITHRVRSFVKGILIPATGLALVAALLYLEPDYGTIMVIGLTGGILMFIAGARMIFLLPVGALSAVGLLGFALMNPNRARRFYEFLNETPYQVEQSLLAFKFGGLGGVGFNNSIQKHKYLPEAHTDFIYAIGGEEFGFFFSILVILAYAAILICGVIVTTRAPDRFGKLLAFGMTFLLVFQAAWNVAMVTHCTITKGLALPFMSYGGTNVIVALAAVGTIMSVGRASMSDSDARSVPLSL